MNTRNLLSATALLAVFSAAGFAAFAQYTGPSSSKYDSVSSVLQDPRDDEFVQLRGTITKKVGEEKYLFSDQTGEIRIDVDNDKFTSPVSEKSVVEIQGEVEKDFMESPEIDVERLTIITN